MDGHEPLRSGREPPQAQSSGSSLMMLAPWLLPTQNVGGVVLLSTKTRRMLVVFGSRYSTNLPVLVSSRDDPVVDHRAGPGVRRSCRA